MYVRHISCPGTTKGFCRVVDCWQSFTYASLKSVRISKALAMVPHRIGTSGGAVSVGAVMLPRVNSMYHYAAHLCKTLVCAMGTTCERTATSAALQYFKGNRARLSFKHLTDGDQKQR